MFFTFTPLTADMTPEINLTASAAETTDNGLKYGITEGGISITGHTDELPSEVVIPSETEGLTVTSIGNDVFIGCDDLTINGTMGSYAETYAKENGIAFRSTEETTANSTTTTSAATATTTQTTVSTTESSYTTPTVAIAVTHETFRFDEVLSYPTKTEYYYGQELDLSGLKFTGISEIDGKNKHSYDYNAVMGFHSKRAVSDKDGKTYGFDEFDTLPTGEYTVQINGSASDKYTFNMCSNVNISYKVTVKPDPEDPSNSSKYVFDKVLSYPKKTVYIQGKDKFDLTGLKFTGKDVTGSGKDREYTAEDCLNSITFFDFIEVDDGYGLENLSDNIDLFSLLTPGIYDVTIRGKAGSKNSTYNCHDVNIKYQITVTEDGSAEPAEKYIPGDANCDEEVNMADAVLIMQSIANPDKYKLSKMGEENADVYDSGTGVTNADALTIQRFKLGLIDDVIIWGGWIDDPTAHCSEPVDE